MKLKCLASVLLVVQFFMSFRMLGGAVWAAAPEGKQETTHSQRALSFGSGYQQLFQEVLGVSKPQGPHLFFNYEYEVKSTFVIGVHLGYRPLGALNQVTYGILMRHDLQPDLDALFRPFLGYGLLFLVTRVQDREGAGTSHDTQLSVGADFQPWGGSATAFQATLSYHYSRLSFFETEPVRLDSVQFSMGPRWRF